MSVARRRRPHEFAKRAQQRVFVAFDIIKASVFFNRKVHFVSRRRVDYLGTGRTSNMRGCRSHRSSTKATASAARPTAAAKRCGRCAVPLEATIGKGKRLSLPQLPMQKTRGGRRGRPLRGAALLLLEKVARAPSSKAGYPLIKRP